MNIINNIVKFFCYIISGVIIVLCIIFLIKGYYEHIFILLVLLVLCFNFPNCIINYSRSRLGKKQVKEFIKYINRTQKLITFDADNIILVEDEICHFNEYARLLQNVPDTYYRVNKSIETEKQKNKLYVTNKRMILFSNNQQYVIPINEILEIKYKKRDVIIFTYHNIQFNIFIDQNKLFQVVINSLNKKK
ncbi:hypothetical protein SH1V18_33160 [Vallitalea longa]|uniref:Uncharacterized protein n=1 Tax=Vallitalea longa TaxID=2936439 RepID=A0A9W5YDV8_9FIRM|nr:hypothetical protein [Vallitalea longa]GKX30836.1 hypothetical protein SH1V18_33160 [Vallitalea longa]